MGLLCGCSMAAGKVVPITDADRRELRSLIESYGCRALRAVGLAHRDIAAAHISSNTQGLSPQELEHDLVLDAIVVSDSCEAWKRNSTGSWERSRRSFMRGKASSRLEPWKHREGQGGVGR